MLTIDDLNNNQSIANIKEVSLSLITDYYEKELMSLEFSYLLRSGKTLTIAFEKSHFAHLIGLQYVSNTSHYKGMSAWNGIRDGSFTLDKLKETNKHGYSTVEDRIRFFPLLKKALFNPFACIYEATNIENSSNKSQLVCDFIIYDEIDNRYIHLGISKYHPSSLRCFPRSFFTQDSNAYIKNQIPLAIEKVVIKKRMHLQEY
jgi:hypothetical protein